MTDAALSRQSSGVAGFDEVLSGGFLPQRAYLVRGGPGTGKTVLGLHFLTAGPPEERPLFITMAEPEEQLRRNAESMNFDLSHVEFLDLSPSSDYFAKMEGYGIFSPSEVERNPVTQSIVSKIEATQPRRIFLDALTQFRYLSVDDLQFRRQAVSLLRYLVEQGATVLFTSEGSIQQPDDDLQFMSDGVIHLALEEWRTLTVTKFRGSAFRTGRHALRLGSRGMEVFPRLLPEAHKRDFRSGLIPSGVPELDELLHGGLERGTITIVTGPSGVGKTTVGLQFMKEAAGRGERSVIYSFEEEIEVMLGRSTAINIPAATMMEQGTLALVKIEPLQYTPEEFLNLVRGEVEHRDARIVMIDSVAGYRLSLGSKEDLVAHLHALCKYLQNMGVAVLLINEVEGVTEFKATESRISYLADNILFLRYLERKTPKDVQLRKAIGVLKKRLSDFDKTLREIEITRYGIKVSTPLRGISSILATLPEWTGESE